MTHGPKLTITLPIPAKGVSPNGKLHWAKKAKLVKTHRARALVLALQALNGNPPPTPVAYSFAYYWPGMHRDDDNAIASGKPYMDGICQALRVDDRHLRFRTLTHHVDRKNPRLEITLYLTTLPAMS